MPIPRYYESEDAFEGIHHNLKLYPCPFCRIIGFLILHGFLMSYAGVDDSSRVKRGHRIFCSNRDQRKGCGRTCSILIAHFIRRFVFTAHSIWHFLKNFAAIGCKAKSMRIASIAASRSAPYNLWRRVRSNLSHIRTSLLTITAPPHVMEALPVIQTVAHLDAAFPGSTNPIIDFQLHFQTSLFAILSPQPGLLS
jgi:hypothetical protein